METLIRCTNTPSQPVHSSVLHFNPHPSKKQKKKWFSRLHTEVKTNETCISFSRQHRQALIKHAWHEFPSYICLHIQLTLKTNQTPAAGGSPPLPGPYAPSSADSQLLYHASHAKTYAKANTQSDQLRAEVCAATPTIHADVRLIIQYGG